MPPAHMRVLNDAELASNIVGYLDPSSQSRFRQVAKCTLNAVEHFVQSRAAQRTGIFNVLLASHQFHAIDTQALIALGEGASEITELRASYGARDARKKDMPFAHWCIEQAINHRSVRPVHLALCLPETDVNAMYLPGVMCNYTPLYWIALHHSQPNKQAVVREVVASLVAHPNIDVNLPSRNYGSQVVPLLAAVENADRALVEELARHPALEWNWAIPETGKTALHKAVGTSLRKEQLSILLPYLGKLNLNAQDMQGNTPLHTAAIHCYQYVENVRLLIDAGADQTIRNRAGYTAYEEAVARGRSEALPFFTVFASPPPKPEAKPEPEPAQDSWQAVLGVGRNERRYAVVREAYKARALAAHPDKGGSAAAFRDVQRAWEQAQLWLTKN